MIMKKVLLGLSLLLVFGFIASISFACAGGGGAWLSFRHDWHNSGFAACVLSSNPSTIRTHNFGVDWYTTPVYWYPNGGKVGTYFVNSVDETLYAIDDDNGNIIWSYSMGSGTRSEERRVGEEG